MKYHNVNGVQVELKKARTKSELITGNFAGEVRNSSDIAQQLTQYNNLSYSQVSTLVDFMPTLLFLFYLLF